MLLISKKSVRGKTIIDLCHSNSKLSQSNRINHRIYFAEDFTSDLFDNWHQERRCITNKHYTAIDKFAARAIMVAEAATTETCTPTIPETKKKKLSVPPGKKYNPSLHPSYYT